MRSLLAFWCCIILLWSCNAKQCNTRSPASGSDTLMTTAQWQGTVHAVTCENIEVKIVFLHKQNSDTGTYQMTQRCKDNNNTFREEGEWYMLRGKELIYVLRGKNGEAHYYKVKGTRLLELDADKKEVTTYYLEKVE